jgi:predicted O-linked N-acetylglucosamine transferase (SPINDLY family)
MPAMAEMPLTPEMLRARGITLRREGRLEQAVAAFEQAIALRADYSPGYYNIASIRLEQGRADEAAALWRKAIEVKPDYYHAHAALGAALRRMGRLDEAIAACRRAIEIKPDYADGYLNLATALHAARRMSKSRAAFETSLRLDPNNVQALNNYAILLIDLDQPAGATSLYQRALQLAPQRAELWNNLANVLKMQGRIDEAIANYRRTLELQPAAHAVHSNLLLTLNAHPRSDAGLLADHVAWAQRHAMRWPAAARFDSDPHPDRRLRVGFVSADFRRHSVSSFFQSLLTEPRTTWEAICYSNVMHPDAMTAQLRAMADGWREVAGISDEQMTQMIRDDRIDILVDLSGHTADNRLLVFARRAAPIQVNYLGYPNTTGLPTMDYRITDAWADPPGMTEAQHTETLVRLPGGFLCYTRPANAPAPRERRGDGEITFGTFNNFAKVTPAMLATWAKILPAVPGSKLLIKAETLADAATQAAVAQPFAAAGISKDRLLLLGREPSFVKHLETYQRIDIALDTFPYHGTTTTCEALWMGVPVVTLAGKAHVSRVGVSLLKQLGLSEWIAHDEAAYVQVATALAQNHPRRQSLSGAALRQRMAKSSLMDRQRFAVEFASALRDMWKALCNNPNTTEMANSRHGAHKP